jgi:hypothetical protein
MRRDRGGSWGVVIRMIIGITALRWSTRRGGYLLEGKSGMHVEPWHRRVVVLVLQYYRL